MNVLAVRKEKGISGGGRNVSPAGAPRSPTHVFDRGLVKATEDYRQIIGLERGRGGGEGPRGPGSTGLGASGTWTPPRPPDLQRTG